MIARGYTELERRVRLRNGERPGKPPTRVAHRRTIVCGVGDGQDARDVARIAARLSDRLLARLILVHVAADPSATGSIGFPPYMQEQLHRLELARARRHLRDVPADTRGEDRAERRVVVGSPATALVGVALEENADLLVVGCRGRHAVTSALLGSVSTALTRSAPCPVVVIGPNIRSAA